jgi:hypothetical protein
MQHWLVVGRITMPSYPHSGGFGYAIGFRGMAATSLAPSGTFIAPSPARVLGGTIGEAAD